jgi:hypothetical protein
MLLERLFVALQPPLSQPRRGVHDGPHAVMAVRRTLAEWRIGGHQSARDLVSLMAASGHSRPGPTSGRPGHVRCSAEEEVDSTTGEVQGVVHLSRGRRARRAVRELKRADTGLDLYPVLRSTAGSVPRPGLLRATPRARSARDQVLEAPCASCRSPPSTVSSGRRVIGPGAAVKTFGDAIAKPRYRVHCPVNAWEIDAVRMRGRTRSGSAALGRA